MMTDNEFDASSMAMVGSNAYPSTAQDGFTQPSVNEKGEAIHYGFAVSISLFVANLPTPDQQSLV
jgi:hypothetical protein